MPLTSMKAYMSNKQKRMSRHFYFSVACIIITSTLICGCSHFSEGLQIRSTFKEANVFFSQGSYITSLSKYEQILEKYPAVGDRVLFEMGIVYAYPGNWQKNYRKSLTCFEKLIKDYPRSEYRQASEVMISHLHNVAIKDKRIIAQQSQIENLEKEIKSQGEDNFPAKKD
jgi:tetratricopeptide (TPR) repeat protein